jgi:hypothetical protein
VLIDPRRELVGVEPDEVTDLDIRHPTLGHQTTNMTEGDAENLRRGRNVDQRVTGR